MSIESSTSTPSAKGVPPDADTTITVVAWRDNVVETHPESHPTSSSETLVWWTPILGPTATLMAHRFAGYVGRGNDRQFTFGDLARTLGMGNSTSRVRASLERLERFGIISVAGETVSVRVALPPLTRRHIEQLPGYLAELYEQRRESLHSQPNPRPPLA
jgi:hypothetical protein